MSEYKAQSLYDPNLEEMDGFTDFVTHELKMNFVDLIFSELEKGEKILSISKVEKRFVRELCQTESRLNLKINDLVRCENCKHGIVRDNLVMCFNSSIQVRIKKLDDYCSDGRQRNEQT